MTGSVEVFLDDTPGEARGVIMRDGRCTHLLIQRDDDVAQYRLGARSVGRVIEVNGALRGAFIDVGAEIPAFSPLKRTDRLTQGERLEVVVTAEPRAGKGAVVRRMGAGQGAPRLIAPAPDLIRQMALLAPNQAVQTGIAAIDAAMEAQDEAMAHSHLFPAFGLDLAIERTRALVAVDIDHSPRAGQDAKAGRAAANREGLHQAARLIALKNWAGLVVIDLIGDGHDGDQQLKTARAAFAAHRDAAFGPVSRFGLLQLALPWGRTPLDEVLMDGAGRESAATRGLAVVRRLRRHLLADTAAPRVVACCAPDEAAVAARFVSRLGPRAVVRADPSIARASARIEEG